MVPTRRCGIAIGQRSIHTLIQVILAFFYDRNAFCIITPLSNLRIILLNQFMQVEFSFNEALQSAWNWKKFEGPNKCYNEIT